MRPAWMDFDGGSGVASCFSTPDLTLIETSRWNGVLRRRILVKIERNERQRCLVQNAGSWGLWVARGTRETAESLRRDQRDSVGLLSMFDDVRDKTSAAREWDRLINLPAEGSRAPASGSHPRTGDTTGAAISPRYKFPCHPPIR
jgi:hypothetical protein